MDPKAAQELIDQLKEDGDEEGARDAQEDLDDWRAKGGFG